MALSSFRWSESWRVLAYSAAAALAFFALERLEFALFDLVGADRLLALTRGKAADDRLAAEALDLAERSRSAAALPSGHRLAAFRLGYEIGWASEYARLVRHVGSAHTGAGGAGCRRARRVRAASRHAASASTAPGSPPCPRERSPISLAFRTASRPTRTTSRRASRQRLTPIHRHLYLLGAHVGAESAKVESNGGTFALPAAALIRRHATLAGIAPALWQPLAADANGESTAQVLERYRAALNALGADLATRDANDARHSSTTAAEPPR